MAPEGDGYLGRVEAAWSVRFGVDRLVPLQVVVRAPAPFVRRPGCISVVRIAQLVAVIVANDELAREIAARVDGLAPDAITTSKVLAEKFVPGAEVAGPASRFSPGPRSRPAASGSPASTRAAPTCWRGSTSSCCTRAGRSERPLYQRCSAR